MKFDILVLKLNKYINDGTAKFAQKSVDIPLHRSTRAKYMGMSNVVSCGRILWYGYYGDPEDENLIESEGFSNQTLRIFDLGHICEFLIVKYLELGGANITGAQLEFKDFDGILRGHCDGVWDDKYILEIKTMNDKKFNTFKTEGIKVSHPVYYMQVQFYLYYSKLQTGFLIAENKNNCEIFIERIDFDKDQFDYYYKKMRNIVTAGRLQDVDSEYVHLDSDECAFCHLKNICYK